MTITDLRKTPFPYFGGKADAAPAVWSALGDPDHYVEPFAGSLAVLLRRPHEANRTYYSETVNDLDGLLVNAWRSMQLSPRETADAASWPVSEADLHARHVAILKWHKERDLERLMGDPKWHDPVIGGWWMWGLCCWIGSGWCSGEGPWWVDEAGRFVKVGKPGVNRKRPHLSNDGQGVNRPQLRDPGVSRQRPHLSSDGQGVNRPQLRDPGVSRKRPHLGDDGQGVNRPQLRDPGVSDGREFHPMTMPELRRWFEFLSARLRHVRILNGDWKRAVTGGASKTLPVRQGGVCGIFLDPPYADTAGRAAVYGQTEDFAVAHAVREWALKAGSDPQYRIVMAGYDGEHGDEFERAGWRTVEWFKGGWLKGGMGNQDEDEGNQQDRERLWCSPHCVGAAPRAQASIFDLMVER